jgi:photosystem II stability/assembly factor-like uncharacterized protein
MLRVAVALSLACVLYDSSLCQIWKYFGGPGGVYSNDILLTASGRLLSSTDKGIYLSDDFGDTWRAASVDPALGIIHAMTERASKTIIAIASNGIVQSTDGGETWAMLFKVYGVDAYRTYIGESPVDSSLFYSTEQFHKSTDGGRTWVEIWTDSSIVDSYAIDKSGTVFLGSRARGLLRSADGGLTFQPYSPGQATAGQLVEWILLNDYGGMYLKLGDVGIVYCENGVATQITSWWADIPLAVTQEGNLIYKYGNCIYVFDRATRQSSSRSCPSFVKDQFAQKAVVHGNTWIAAFSSEGLHRSTDGGVTWSDINKDLGRQPCYSVLATGQSRLYAGTFGFAFWGGIYESDDRGATWTDLNPLNYNASFLRLNTLQNGNLMCSGTYGLFIGNHDATNQHIFWTHPMDADCAYSQFVSRRGVAYVGSSNAYILVSRDNGSTWVQSTNGLQGSYFMGLGESTTGRVFASALQSGTFYTDDDGLSWKSSSGLPSVAYDFTYKGDTVFAAASGDVFSSTDNGITWQYTGGVWGSIRRLLVAPNGDLLAGASPGGVFRSRDDGRSWDTLNNGLANLNILDLTFDMANRLYAATDSGIYYTDAFATGPDAGVVSFSLEQNFPNPFNSSTIIRFDLPSSGLVSLNAYNLAGQRVATLFSKNLQNGRHLYEWNPASLSSGVYFLRLEGNGFGKTIKTILLK